MIFGKVNAAVMVGLVLSCVGWNVAFAQVAGKAFVGRVYSLHTDGVGGCPSLDWHIVVGENHTLSGMIGADNMSVMFHVTGTYSADGTFHLDGKEVGGSRTGAVNGVIRRSGILVATLGGLPVESPCQGTVVYVRPTPPYNAFKQSGAGGVAG